MGVRCGMGGRSGWSPGIVTAATKALSSEMKPAKSQCYKLWVNHSQTVHLHDREQ